MPPPNPSRPAVTGSAVGARVQSAESERTCQGREGSRHLVVNAEAGKGP